MICVGWPIMSPEETFMTLKASFTEHPASVGETYGEHFTSAMGFSLSLFKAAICCGIHAFLPFLFEKTGSNSIVELHDRMVAQRSRHKNCDPGAERKATA